MKKFKVFIDGSEGTTGLRINERFLDRDDIEVMKIDSELRKDPVERARLINASDYTFLCLPDAAAIEAVTLIDKNNDHTVIIDASTAHRTNPEWAYGLPELSSDFENAIKTSRRIANPGCYASGFIMMAYPLVKGDILAEDYPMCISAVSGYSGAGKKAIALYEDENKREDLFSPRQYALTQQHKHLKEMKAIVGLSQDPIFIPTVDDYYCGMIVNLPIHANLMKKKMSVDEIRSYLADYYAGKQFIRVCTKDDEEGLGGFIHANKLAGKDYAEIYVTGNDDRMTVSAVFDNLGKGASGAAVECLNISMGVDAAKGLVL